MTLLYSPTNAEPQFFRNLPPLFISAEASSGNQGIIMYKEVDLPTSCLLPLQWQPRSNQYNY